MKVGDRLFRVARQELAKESPVFESMFSLPNSGEAVKVEGQTDDNPIHLNGYKPEEFEALLTLLYPTSVLDFILIRCRGTSDSTDQVRRSYQGIYRPHQAPVDWRLKIIDDVGDGKGRITCPVICDPRH